MTTRESNLHTLEISILGPNFRDSEDSCEAIRANIISEENFEEHVARALGLTIGPTLGATLSAYILGLTFGPTRDRIRGSDILGTSLVYMGSDNLGLSPSDNDELSTVPRNVSILGQGAEVRSVDVLTTPIVATTSQRHHLERVKRLEGVERLESIGSLQTKRRIFKFKKARSLW